MISYSTLYDPVIIISIGYSVGVVGVTGSATTF